MGTDETFSGDEDKAISLHFGNLARCGFNISFLRRSVRKARKDMLCVKFIQRDDCKEE